MISAVKLCIVSLVLAIIVLTSTHQIKAQPALNLSPDEIRELATEAYIYGL